MDSLQKHIDDNHDGNISEFARCYSKALDRQVLRQQVSRWISMNAEWDDKTKRIKLEPRTRGVV